MQTNLRHNLFIPIYSTSNCAFEFGKCGGKEGKKLQKFEYLENEKNFLSFNELISSNKALYYENLAKK